MNSTVNSADSWAAVGTARGVSAVSWDAIAAGAVVAAAASLVLFVIGTGLGLEAVTPWARGGMSSTAFGVTAAIWLIVTQWLAACLGGYTAGRLRTRWLGTHAHEVFFRDTAHGLITWAAATLLVAAGIGSSLLSFAGGAAHIAGDTAAGAQGMLPATRREAGAHAESPGSYALDKLFRGSAGAGLGAAASGGPGPAGTGGPGGFGGPGGPPGAVDPITDVTRVTANALATGSVPEDDRAYLGALVAARTGIPLTEAQKRVDDFLAAASQAQDRLKAAADQARRDTAQSALYMALALLIGAFIGSVSAAIGGRLRDEHP